MSETASWQPSAPIANLLKRATIMSTIRRFFSDRGVLEVDTPAMSQATVTDIHLVPFQTHFVGPGAAQGMTLYMMTSPEYHMKRLLAAGSGPIYQLGKASVMRSLAVTTIQSSACWSGIAHTTICIV